MTFDDTNPAWLTVTIPSSGDSRLWSAAIVTFNSARPDTLSVRMPTDIGVYEYRIQDGPGAGGSAEVQCSGGRWIRLAILPGIPRLGLGRGGRLRRSAERAVEDISGRWPLPLGRAVGEHRVDGASSSGETFCVGSCSFAVRDYLAPFPVLRAATL